MPLLSPGGSKALIMPRPALTTMVLPDGWVAIAGVEIGEALPAGV